ncbi:MAG TPA: hypothetical protein VFT39_13305 [Vicinamibacterales bacterium]|nr:hypothetical protein [Vicinamibacterales bacterium]
MAVSPLSQITPSADDPTRASRIAALRAQANEHIRQERLVFSEEELRDIEARYRSAHQQDYPMLLKPDAAPILRELVTRYPKAHRSGCAVLDLARLVSGEARERYLQEAIANHNDAWCESGVQVGALARARLAIHYADQQRLEDAERLAKKLVTLFPDAIDDSGALLNGVLRGVQLLR